VTFIILISIFSFSWVVEICQDRFTDGRTYQQKDLIANSVGIAAGAILHSVGSLIIISLLKIKMILFREKNWEKVQSLNIKTKVSAFVLAPLVIGLTLYLNTYLENFLDIIVRSRSHQTAKETGSFTTKEKTPESVPPKVSTEKVNKKKEPYKKTTLNFLEVPPVDKKQADLALVSRTTTSSGRQGAIKAKQITEVIPTTPRIPQVNVKKKSFIERLHEKAESGHDISQFKLGCLYFQGNKVKKDIPKAIQLLEDAANNNNIDSQKFLAFSYQSGSVLSKDTSKAFEWFKRAAWHEDPEAQFQLGICYLNGTGTKQNLTKARLHLELAANNNFVDAMLVVGKMYLHGIGVAKNSAKGAGFIKGAASAGNSEAEILLSELK